jgi:hypothetical protein
MGPASSGASRQPPAPPPTSTPTADPAFNADAEAAELTRWTLAEEEPFTGGEPIPSLAAEQHPAGTPSAELSRFEGASAQDTGGHDSHHSRDAGSHDAGIHDASIAETLFGQDGHDGALGDDDDFLLSESPAVDARAGAVRESAPLEPFFDGSGALITSDIDRKIDEALELAERMRAPRKTTEIDDLDVPAFLRNGMKDLPLD